MTSSTSAQRLIGVDVSMSQLDLSDSQARLRQQIPNSEQDVLKQIVNQIDAPAIRLSLRTLRPRRASLRFIEHLHITSPSPKYND